MKFLLLLLMLLLNSHIYASESQNKPTYDYIVVGAGSAGSIVAAKLAESGASVLILEAGGDDTEPAVKDMRQYFNVAFNSFNYGFMNWNFTTTGQTFVDGTGPTNFTLPQGKILGGTHSINASAFVTGHRDDFNSIAREIDDDDWSWDSVSEYVEELQDTLKIITFGREQEGAREHIESAKSVLGFKFNKDCDKGKQNGVCPSVWTGMQGEFGGVRSTSYDAFLRPLLDEEDVEIVSLTFHRVDKINFDPNDPARVVGVKAMNLRSNIATDFTATKDVIISAGTYNSPKILLLSGVGPREELEALGIPVQVELEGVGKNLRDHYGVSTFWQLEGLDASSPYLFNQPSLNMFGPQKNKATTFQFEISGGFGSVVPLKAESVGEVSLATSDPEDWPLIDPNVLSTRKDLNTLVNGLQSFLLPFFADLVEKGLYSPVNIDPAATRQEIIDFVRENVETKHHPVGTSKIGASTDPFAVVDSNFLVQGTSNLRVVDASVFPRVPSGNTNAPTMTIALLAANKIIDDD